MGHEEEGHRDRELPRAADRPRRRQGQDALTPRADHAARVGLAVAGTIGASFAAKAAALRWLAGRPPVELVGGTVRFVLVENPGAFLGLGRSLSEGSRRAIFVVAVGALLAAALAWLVAAAADRLGRLRTVAAGMLVGGGLANWLDRIPDNRVTDYVVLSAGPVRTGIFNLADAAILAGAVLWLLGRPREGYAGVEDRKGGPE